MLPDGDSTSENQAPPVTVPTRPSEEQREKKTVQVAEEPADTSPFVHCNVNNSSLQCPSQVELRESHPRQGEEPRG